MSLYTHRQWAALDVADQIGDPPPGVFLFHGDDFLVQQALDRLIDSLLPGADRALGLERFDGPDADLDLLLERINTYSFMGGRRVFVLADHPVFGASDHLAGLWKRLETAQNRDDVPKGLSLIRHMVAICQIAAETLDLLEWPAQLKLPSGFTGDRTWLDARIATVRDDPTPLPAVTTVADRIATAVHRGFPNGHILVVATDAADKRRRLYGQIKENGVVVDCSLPKGERKADRDVRETATTAVLRETAAGFGKTLAADAVHALTDRLGDNLRAACTSVETLAAYVGERKTITAADVAALVPRSRKDPVFALTNAVRAGDVPGALTVAHALMADDMHPLQILSAMANVVRRLRVARAFLDSAHGRCWHFGCSYREFTDRVVTEVKQYDQQTIAGLEAVLGHAPRGMPTAKEISDVQLASKGGSPYPLFLLLSSAAEAAAADLDDALLAVADTDGRLKSGSSDGSLDIERLIVSVCRCITSGRP